jgi:2,4-didehydro-3-deoxy-L-rhamnonate hydrolase
MKLFRFGELNKERPGVILNNVMYDASAFGEDYNEHFFEENGLQRLQ